jgi:GDP/UDP-N,N'-diacetylbacillosamine 2-epimerase (hydrolysing)
MKKVCVVTGSRADYGLLRWVIEGIRDSNRLELQLVATGMHLSPEFGLTWREIEADGFVIDRRVETLLSSDTPVGIAKSMGLGIIGFADAYVDLNPDLVLVLGDRYETFAAAAAAMVACVPVAHLHGGEATEGLIDEAIRHSITKMAQLHFVAAEPYRRRVLQLGEAPERVFNVGGLGIDGMLNHELLKREALEKSLGMRFGSRNLMVTFHPVTLEHDTASSQMSELLDALDQLRDTNLIFTMPNADTSGRVLIRMVEDFAAGHPNAFAYTSLGQLRYLSCLQYVDGVIGNSSSGLSEVPSFKKGTVNIGDRQKGRVRAKSVIDCAPNRAAISAAIAQLYSSQFQNILPAVENPYGRGGASQAVVGIIESMPFEDLILKSFVDLSSP